MYMQYTYHTTGPSSIHRKSHLNNGVTTVKMGMPFKPNTMAQGSMFSNARAEFTENVSSVSDTKKWYGSAGSRTTSSYISSKRNRSIGKSSTMQGLSEGSEHQYKSNDKAIRNTALARCRAGGCTAPKKKSA
tara:strand:+ start:191 stop:586 length:396 start_codon:yes stop_codon:yes gene_type:complete